MASADRLPHDSAHEAAHETGVLRVGIDENGLGPRLGPLVVTAIAARTWGKGDGIATSSPRGRLAARIGDSKKLVSFSDSVLGEAWARALTAERSSRLSHTPPESPDTVVRALSIDARATLERPCPADHMTQCWGTDGEAFGAEDSLVAQLVKDLASLRAKGVAVLGAHVAIVCTERLNEAAARGISRFQTDLFAMERLILHARESYGTELDATCGKVGGYASYPPAFGPLAGRLFTTVEEGQARSEYRIANLGRVSFVRDADSGHLLVALASLVGKWVRDLLTRRVTRYHRAHDPGLPEASGYHDPITTRFIEASALARKERGVADACFERRAAAKS
jgi:ribonuclease HII